MKGEFVIMDPKGRFLMGLASSIRGLAHDFTNAEDFGLFCKIGHGHRDETRRICRLSAA